MTIAHSLRIRASHFCVVAIVLSLMAAGQASATTIIQGSGVNADLSSTFQRDANWDIVAYPATNTMGSPSLPYSAYVPRTVPGVWYGGNTGTNGSQGGYSANGNTYYWISPTSTDASIAAGSYNWIAAQTFNVTTAGAYVFNFYASGDNGIRFFIDGSIDTTDAQKPNITGGTQIGGYADNFSGITQYEGIATLSAGTHTAYMVLYDFGGSTGALIGQSVFQPVPEPSTSCMALAGLACGGFSLWRRRKQARLPAARSPSFRSSCWWPEHPILSFEARSPSFREGVSS